MFNQNMLTKTDLQQIRGVVREEVEAEVGNFKHGFDSNLARLEIRNSYELTKINDRLKNLEIGQRKIQKDLTYQINILDKDHLSNLRRITRIEEKLQIQPTV
jgi:hypothetical protein